MLQTGIDFHVVVAIGLLQLVIASTLIVYLVSAKVARRTRAHRRARLLAFARPHLLALATNTDADGAAFDALKALSTRKLRLIRGNAQQLIERVHGRTRISELYPVADIRDALDDRRGWRRARAAWLLGIRREPDLGPRVVALLHDRDGAVRIAAALSRAIDGDPSTPEELVAAVRAHEAGTTDALPTWLASDALLRQGDNAIPVLRSGLADPDPEIRYLSAMTVTHGRYGSLLPQLRQALAGEPEELVRERQINALGFIGETSDVTTVRGYTSPEEPTVVRTAAVDALRHLGALEELAPLLADTELEVAERAATALALSGAAGARVLRSAPSGPVVDYARSLSQLLRRREPISGAITIRPERG